MELADVPLGNESFGTVAVALSEENSAVLRSGLEVEVFVTPEADELLMRVGQAVFVLDEEHRSAAALRDACHENLPRVSWIEDIRRQDERLVLSISTRCFSREISLDAVDLAVTEQLFKDLERHVGVDSTRRQVLDWLDRNFLARIPTRDAQSRAVITIPGGPKAPKDDSEFVIHGKVGRVWVRRAPSGKNDGSMALVVQRFSKKAASRSGVAVLLGVGRIKFEDYTSAGVLRAELQAQINTVRQSEASFLGAWERYGRVEREQLAAKLTAVNVLRFERIESLGAGRFALFIAVDVGSEALVALAKGDELQVSESVPSLANLMKSLEHDEVAAELTEAAAAVDSDGDPDADADGGSDIDAAGARGKRSSGNARGADACYGSVEDVSKTGIRVIRIRCDGDSRPPESGYAVFSIRGDRLVHKRRRQALQRLLQANAGIQQLALMVEGVPGRPVARRKGREDGVSANVLRKIFSDPSGRTWQPTDAQRQAIEVALNTPDIAVIQGPPGTGKTTVMRAIIERVHELNSKRPDQRERLLVTGFQHDAVENAIEKLSVNDLPAIKVGTRRDADSQQTDLLDEARRLEEFRGRIRGRAMVGDSGPLAERLSWVERMLVTYRRAPSGAAETAEFLREMRRRLDTDLPTELLSELEATAIGIELASRRDSEDEDTQFLRRAIRAIRTCAASFADDGPVTARRVLVRLGRHGLGTTENLRALEVAASSDHALKEEHLADLARLKRHLLLKVVARGVFQGQPLRNTAFEELLEAVVQHLRATYARSTDGASRAVHRFLEDLRDDDILREAIVQYTPVVAATCQQSVSTQMLRHIGDDGSGEFGYDTVLCDEAARANPLDLLVPLSCAKRRIVLVGDHRQLPHIVDDAIERKLLEDVSRDPSQDGQHVREATQAALRESLFERLFHQLAEKSSQDLVPRVVTLDEQYRMHPRLGEFVSREFYPPEERFKSPRPASDFYHSIRGLEGRCAHWQDVPFPQRGESRDGTSWKRTAEAREIARLLRSMLDDEGARLLNFGVITFYRAQVDEIQRALVEAEVMIPNESGAEFPDAYADRVRIGTVDQFQGREFDVVFLSLVRSNQQRDGTEDEQRRRYGHLMSVNRLCVSMSRQKRLLVVVGDSEMVASDGARRAIPQLVAFKELAEQDAAEANGEHA